jgi:hypothetical protein
LPIFTGQRYKPGPHHHLRSSGFPFRSKLTFAEGEDPAVESNLGGERFVAGLHASLILVIALSEAEDNNDPG